MNFEWGSEFPWNHSTDSPQFTFQWNSCGSRMISWEKIPSSIERGNFNDDDRKILSHQESRQWLTPRRIRVWVSRASALQKHTTARSQRNVLRPNSNHPRSQIPFVAVVIFGLLSKLLETKSDFLAKTGWIQFRIPVWSGLHRKTWDKSLRAHLKPWPLSSRGRLRRNIPGDASE